MLYSGVSWAMDLLTHLLHYFFVVLPSFFIIPHCLYPLFYNFFIYYHVSFFATSDDFSHFNAWRTVMSPSTPSSWTLVWRSLVKKVILSMRVCICHCLRVYPFHNVFSVEFICLIFRVCEEKKRNKRMYLCMYIVFFSIECRYWSLIAILLSQLLMKVRMWTFRRLSPPCAYFIMYFTCERQVTFS